MFCSAGDTLNSSVDAAGGCRSQLTAGGKIKPTSCGLFFVYKVDRYAIGCPGGGIGKLTFRNQRNLASSAYHFTAFVLNLSGLFLPARKSLGRSPARSDAAQI